MVTYLPSLPANGPLLAMNCMVIVGSSTVSGGRTRGALMAVMVSPTLSSVMPVAAMMSPAPPRPLRAAQALIGEELLDAKLFAPSPAPAGDQHAIAHGDAPPLDAADGDVAQVVVVVERRHLQTQRRIDIDAGGGTRSTIMSRSGVRSPAGRRILHRIAVSTRGEDHREVELGIGGPSATNRSKTAFTVPCGSQPSRSILLTTRSVAGPAPAPCA